VRLVLGVDLSPHRGQIDELFLSQTTDCILADSQKFLNAKNQAHLKVRYFSGDRNEQKKMVCMPLFNCRLGIAVCVGSD
jgi:hypothetical protein